MRFLLAFENPWCLFSLLLTIALLLIAAALLSYSRSRSRSMLPRSERDRVPQPSLDLRQPEITATAPYEALLVIQERLADMQRHLPAHSEDARWLEGYRNDLRNVMDDVYWELYHTSEEARQALLARLDREVAQLNQTIGAHISARISRDADRTALRTQLDRLRDVTGG
ncbi:MAG TPA: hypothetical protein VGD58_12265 [Herpetosiphonaceae bacterium]